MSNFKLKPTHAPVKAYYETLEKCARGKFDNEGNIRRAFESLLEKCARPFEWFVVGEYQIARSGKSPLRVDAAGYGLRGDGSTCWGVGGAGDRSGLSVPPIHRVQIPIQTAIPPFAATSLG